MDEEAQKRNTDCVYFLASPLTCKKGNGCEFRHSEAARINPRDCWFWLSGNCLHANCPFRHPPLDGRPLSTSTPVPTATVATASTSTAAATVSSKSKTPCYYFSQGYCAKGDKCPFMHGPSVASSTEGFQKPPKVPVSKVLDKTKSLSVAKENGSTPNKEKTQEVQAPSQRKTVSHSQPLNPQSNAFLALHKIAQNNAERSRKVESTVEDGKGRKSTDQGSKLHLALESNNTSWQGERKQRLEDDVLQQVQLADKRLLQSLAREDRKQNGSRTAGGWNNIPPDYADDESDHSLQKEDGEFSGEFEPERSRSQGRMKQLDDSVDFESVSSRGFGLSGYYSRNYYEQGPYEPHDQQPDNDSSQVGRKQNFAYNSRSSARERLGLFVEQNSQNISGDLRDHLRRRKSESVGLEGRNRTTHQDAAERLFPKSQVFSERAGQNNRLTSRGVKRQYDSGSVFEGGSPERGSLRSSPNRRSADALSRSETKEKDSGWHASSANKQLEQTKEMPEFVGPKSLAQIKAERRAGAEAGGKAIDGVGDVRSQISRPLSADGQLALKSQVLATLGSTSDNLNREGSSTSERKGSSQVISSHESNFEGPKPFSLILKEKRKAEPFEEAGMEMASKRSAHATASSVEIGEAPTAATDISEHFQDGEGQSGVLDSGDTAHIEFKDGIGQNKSPTESSLQEVSVQRSGGLELAKGNLEEAMEGGSGIGGNASGEDDGIEDDDDEDDFAKKLGGFFS